jgi:hypothetical protein
MQRVSDEELERKIKRAKGTSILSVNEPGVVWPYEVKHATEIEELALDLRDLRAAARKILPIFGDTSSWDHWEDSEGRSVGEIIRRLADLAGKG